MLRRKLDNSSTSTSQTENENKKLRINGSPNNDLLNLSVDNCRPTDVSKYFQNLTGFITSLSVVDKILQLQIKLNNNLSILDMIKPPIEYVYNPLEYAFKANEAYVRKYCTTTKKILFVGMNPGPFGMCQTGVPFGDPRWVRDWLKIEADVLKPTRECPERKILGFSSQRKEQSGHRFWGLFAEICKSPEFFFKYSFVTNYCPLAFMKFNGNNVTPIEIKLQDRKALEKVCDSWYLSLLEVLKPEVVIAIGEYMEKKTKELFKNNNINIKIIRMPHPSPRAARNQNWSEKAENFLKINNLMQYFKN